MRESRNRESAKPACSRFSRRQKNAEWEKRSAIGVFRARAAPSQTSLQGAFVPTHPLHRIFGHMHKVLNIDEKN
jgi:hypothetical protein